MIISAPVNTCNLNSPYDDHCYYDEISTPMRYNTTCWTQVTNNGNGELRLISNGVRQGRFLLHNKVYKDHKTGRFNYVLGAGQTGLMEITSGDWENFPVGSETGVRSYFIKAEDLISSTTSTNEHTVSITNKCEWWLRQHVTATSTYTIRPKSTVAVSLPTTLDFGRVTAGGSYSKTLPITITSPYSIQGMIRVVPATNANASAGALGGAQYRVWHPQNGSNIPMDGTYYWINLRSGTNIEPAKVSLTVPSSAALGVETTRLRIDVRLN